MPDVYLKHLERLRQIHVDGPHIGNTFLEDSALQEYSKHLIGQNTAFRKELIRLGDRFSTVYLQAAKNAERNPPTLEQFDSYGRRIDELYLSEGWKQLAKMSEEDGIVALAYDEEDPYQLGYLQRYGQLVALCMYHPSSGLYGCPLAMTDGAAYTLRDVVSNVASRRSYFYEAYTHLISRTDMWTSGQWMTEKKGGSDVSNTETVAIKEPNSEAYRLYGYKWFTSATDSRIALALAKILPVGVEPTESALRSESVSLFFVKMKDEKGNLNNIEIIRLKDKLGTKQLPTAELVLKGTEAYLVGPVGKGVKMISKMLTVTRMYNSATAVGLMQRMVALARDYAHRRTIAKSKLAKIPLQLRILSEMEVTHRANLIFYLKISELFSKEQAKCISADDANILRIMTPLLKLFTGKEAVKLLSEGLEMFGGFGYIEGTMLPTMLRDAQVLTIWEGTTNVLCHDFVRSVLKQENNIPSFESLLKFFSTIFERITSSAVNDRQFRETNKEIVLQYNILMADLQSAIKTSFRESGA